MASAQSTVLSPNGVFQYGLANYSLQAQVLAPAGLKQSFTGTQPHPFNYLLSEATSTYPAELVTATETLWPTKPRTLTGNLCQPMFDSNWPQALKSSQAVTYFKLSQALCSSLAFSCFIFLTFNDYTRMASLFIILFTRP